MKNPLRFKYKKPRSIHLIKNDLKHLKINYYGKLTKNYTRLMV
jgi:hypothetical protein